MRTTFRFLLIAIVALGIVGAIGSGVASWYVMRKLGPDFWVALIEKNTHCRADISDVKLSLFTQPSTLTLKNLRLAPRDKEVAKPLGERAALSVDATPIMVPEVILEVKLEDLINRRLFIQRLSLERPMVKEFQDEAGHSSLAQLFSEHAEPLPSPPPSAMPMVPPARYDQAAPVAASPPVTRYEENPSAPPAPRAIPLTQVPPADSPDLPTGAADSPKTADPDRFAVSIAAAEIKQGQLTIVNRNTTTAIENLDFSVTGIDIAALEAAQPNQIHVAMVTDVRVSGMARIDGVKKPAELAYLKISGSGDIAPIDPKTGAWNPRSTLKLILAKGSVLAGHITMGDAAGKEMLQLQEYGIDLSPVVIGGILQQDAIIDGVFTHNRFTLKAPTRLIFPEYELALELHSWINGTEDQHSMRLHLSCGPALQQRLETGIAQAKLGENVASAVTKALADEQGRMTFDIVSSGPLSDPKIKPSLDRILKNLLRGEGIGDLLKGLFRKN